MNNKIIGQRINTLLAINNVKQKELAKELGVADNIVSYFVGGSRTPNIQQIIKISQFFNVSTDYILGLTDVSSTDAELKSICEYTGLNEKAILFLREIKDSAKYNTLINILLENNNDYGGARIVWFMDDVIDYSKIRYWTNHIEHTYIDDFNREVLIPKGVNISKFNITEDKAIHLGAWAFRFRSFIKEKLKKKNTLEWYEEHYIHYDKGYATYRTQKRVMQTVNETYIKFSDFLKQTIVLRTEEGVTNGDNPKEE